MNMHFTFFFMVTCPQGEEQDGGQLKLLSYTSDMCPLQSSQWYKKYVGPKKQGIC